MLSQKVVSMEVLKKQKFLHIMLQSKLGYDDLSVDEKLKIYDKGVSMTRNDRNIYKMKVDYRIGEMYAPLTDSAEALGCLTNHFRNCILGKEKPITSSTSGL